MSEPASVEYSLISTFGMEVETLNDFERRRLGLNNDVTGALVRAVEPNGRAANVGLRPGDVIFDGRYGLISNRQEFLAQLQQGYSYDRDNILFHVNRNGNIEDFRLELQ